MKLLLTTVAAFLTIPAAWATGDSDGALAPPNSCNSNADCYDGICNDYGECVPDSDGIGAGDRCRNDRQCPSGFDGNGACGYLPGRHASGPKVCCPSGESRNSAGNPICTGREDGYRCAGPNACASGVCRGGVCRPLGVDPGFSCGNDKDCDNGACGLVYPEDEAKVCCPSGEAAQVFLRGKKNCVDLPPGDACGDPSMCAKGACARVTGGDTDVCCPSSATTYINQDEYCANLAAGSRCKVNKVCASGLCNRGTCQGNARPGDTCSNHFNCRSGTCGQVYGRNGGAVCCDETTNWDGTDYCTGQANGEPCANGRMCNSGRCNNRGVCAPQQVGAGYPCSGDDSCQNNNCALDWGSNQKVCCDSGSTARYQNKEYCAGLPNDSRCGSGQMCDSGNCQNGVCSPRRVGPGQPCSVHYNNCQTGTCGQVFGSDGGDVCCDETINWNGQDYCAGLPNDSRCGNGQMCESGNCQNGICSPRRVGPGQPCSVHYNNCQTGTCGQVYGSGGGDVCCDETTNLNGQDYCTGQANGEPCGNDRMCNSGRCNDRGVCAPQQVGAGERCTNDNSCQNYSCGFLWGSNYKVCCESGSTTRYQNKAYCDDLPNSSRCGDGQMCRSGNCHDNVCRPSRVGSGQPCSNHYNCRSGKCGQVYGSGGVDVCCDETTNWDGTDYCTGQANGEPCANGRMCNSGRCNSRGVCAPQQVGAGHPCINDDSCQNDSCALDWESNQKVCCESGTTARYLNREYCAGLPNDSRCGNGQMCKSGNCQDNICRPRGAGAGHPCYDDFECESGRCGDFFGGETAICCPSGGTIKWGGSPYCTDRPNGTRCATDEMCESRHCEGGICRPFGAGAGGDCYDNHDCDGTDCALLYHGGGDLICCPGGGSVWYGDNQYCMGLDDDKPCGNDDMCRSHHCSNGFCRPAAGGSGERCVDDGDCSSYRCIYNVCD